MLQCGHGKSGEWNDYAHDFQNHVLIEYIPNDMPEEPMVEGTWKMAPMPGALRVGPEPLQWRLVGEFC